MYRGFAEISAVSLIRQHDLDADRRPVAGYGLPAGERTGL
jgi:hypothetical protein